MLKLYLLSSLTLLLGNSLSANELNYSIKIDFSLVENNIILHVKDKQGDDLNIIFDSAANGFLLDSAVSKRLDIQMEVKESGASFMNGTVKARDFFKQEVFESAFLNELYKSGSSLDMKFFSGQLGVRIDGLIGLGEYMKITAGIDFHKRYLHIGEDSFEPKREKDYLRLKMLYTDAGFESSYSRAFRGLPACKVRLTLADSVQVETNLHFDTGFNKKFALMTTLDVDSIIKAVNKPFTTANKRVSSGEQMYDLYYLSADSIFIDTLEKNYATDIVLNKASVMAITGFGTSEWMCLCGTGFLKQFKEVHFDMINRYIFLKVS